MALRFFLLALLAALAGCAGQSAYFRDAGPAPQVASLTLASWPHAETWTGVVFNGDKVGFAHTALRGVGAERYELESDASLRLRFLGVDKRVTLHALDRVRADLTLESFTYQHEIDGSILRVSGNSDGRSLDFTVEASGTREARRIELTRPLYPSSALNMLPALRGLAIGLPTRDAVFHSESQSIEEVEQEVVSYESSSLFDGPAFKVMTRLLGLETSTWISADGRPLFELALQGVMISALEEEPAAKRYLVEASLNKNDTILDFSLVRASSLADPRGVSGMEVRLDGIPPAFTVPSEGGQQCRRNEQSVFCRIDAQAEPAAGSAGNYLRATLAAPSTDAEIVELARKLGVGATSDDERIATILGWIDRNIAKEAVDVFTAVDVLRGRRAECQGHAYLYAALARALGMPTRVVNGLVYSSEHGGFLYHTWNETLMAGRGWQPVDATFGQRRADATHVKLIEGESVAELAPLVSLVGRLRAPHVAVLSRW
jgi:hypothetical protein